MRRVLFFPAIALIFAWSLCAQPVAPTSEQIAELRAGAPEGPPRAAASTPLTVNIASREEVRQFYRAIYNASEGVAMNWTGSYATGAPGDTSVAFKEAVLLRINFFRALVGIPATVTLNSTYSAKAQQAALMMSANQSLSHFPPTSWTFYTAAGAEAAGKSNLALGTTGPDSITGLMNDDGDNNAAVGHRRWLIYPQTREMGTGDVPGNGSTFPPANSTWVQDGLFGTTRPATRTTAVPYPPAGFVPHTLVWPRWSFSYPGANFSNATVTMTRNGQNISATLEPLSSGLGEPTLVWVYDGQNTTVGAAHARPTADTVYTVTLNNVLISGASQNFSYTVTVFDPDVPGADFSPVAVSGSATPTIGAANSYTAAKPDFASSFEWRSLQLTAFSKTYGAESGLDGITATTAGDYSVVQSGVAGAGASSYHLAHTNGQNQTLTLPETFAVTGGGAAVTFLSRLGFASSAQIAHVQVSTDDGVSWSDIYTQAGSGGSGEAGFAARSGSLAVFANRTIRLRLTYTFSVGSYFPQSSNGVGWYVDNLTLTGVQSVTPGTTTSVSSGTTISFTPATAGLVGLQARGVLFDAYPLEWGPIAQVTAIQAANPPTFSTQPSNQSAGAGGSASFTASASGSPTFQWQHNGTAIANAANSTLTVSNAQPINAGVYVAVVTNAGGTTASRPAMLGLQTASKVIGDGAEISANIPHPNTNIFDQILLQGVAASFTADPTQVTRLSYIDLTDDIVQIEFAGAGTVSLVLDGSSGPAVPIKYSQGVPYMKGHAGIVVTGANETTNLSVFTVGRATAFDPTGAYNILQAPSATNNPANNGSSLFVSQGATIYDGLADIAFVAIASTNGKFGGLRTANASYWATKGVTGVYAPDVQFTGPVFVGEIEAKTDATPYLQIGSAGVEVRITGGDLQQENGRAVQVSGITQLFFREGSTSHGTLLSAKTNQGVLEQGGVNVTAQIVVNPTP